MNDCGNAFSPAQASTALRWLAGVSDIDKWNLTLSEQARLLGLIDRQTYFNWLSQASHKNDVELPHDAMVRLNYLLSIFRSLHSLAPSDINDPDLQFELFSRPNHIPPFGGKSIKEYLLATGSMDALERTVSYLRHLAN